MEEKKNTVAAATPSNPTDKTAPAPSKKPEDLEVTKVVIGENVALVVNVLKNPNQIL